jgi:hypothetical protein
MRKEYFRSQTDYYVVFLNRLPELPALQITFAVYPFSEPLKVAVYQYQRGQLVCIFRLKNKSHV